MQNDFGIMTAGAPVCDSHLASHLLPGQHQLCVFSRADSPLLGDPGLKHSYPFVSITGTGQSIAAFIPGGAFNFHYHLS